MSARTRDHLRLGLAAFAVGLVFSVGLGISGMTDPNNIVAFLDLTGAWDPRLAFVMAGAVGTGLVLFRVVARRGRPLFDDRFFLPKKQDLDRRLVGGAALFGIGWGLGGFCPGPAITAAVTGSGHVVAFLVAMLAGMAIHDRVLVRAARPADVPGAQAPDENASPEPAIDDDPVCAG